jgi:hypothetical protein
MKKLLCTAAAISILMLSGCANNGRLTIQPIMEPRQSPAMSSSYVAGMFSQEWESGKTSLGLGIVNTATAEEFVIPFGTKRVLLSDVVDEIAMIQLPPGEYRIAYWLNYSTTEKEQITRTDISADSMSGLPFKLAPGEVVFLGSYVAKKERSAGSEGVAQTRVRHQRLTLQSARKSLSNSYPAFAAQAMSCPSCLE